MLRRPRRLRHRADLRALDAEAEALVGAAAQLDASARRGDAGRRAAGVAHGRAPPGSRARRSRSARRRRCAPRRRSTGRRFGPIASRARSPAAASSTADYVEDLGANLKGFLALEYLLFDPDGDDAAVLDALTATRIAGAFVRALAENLRDQGRCAARCLGAGGGQLRRRARRRRGRGAPRIPTVKSAVDELVNQLIFLSEDIADAQLLAPLGGRNGGAPDPEALDAHRSEQRPGRSARRSDRHPERLLRRLRGAGRGASFSDVIVSGLDPRHRRLHRPRHPRAFETATRIPHPLEQRSDDRRRARRARAGARQGADAQPRDRSGQRPRHHAALQPERRGLMRRLIESCSRRSTPRRVAAFRVAFGVLMFVAVVRYFAHDWIEQFFVAPRVFFPYPGLEWIVPLPAAGMYALFAALGVLALCVAVGLWYRASVALFCLGFTYVHLIDRTNYLNHYYLVSLLSLLIVFAAAAPRLVARRLAPPRPAPCDGSGMGRAGCCASSSASSTSSAPSPSSIPTGCCAPSRCASGSARTSICRCSGPGSSSRGSRTPQLCGPAVRRLHRAAAALAPNARLAYAARARRSTC